MFNDFQRSELVGRLLLILEQDKAGRADARQELAEKLVDAAREYLDTQYSAKPQDTGGYGITRSTDVIKPEDFDNSRQG